MIGYTHPLLRKSGSIRNNRSLHRKIPQQGSTLVEILVTMGIIISAIIPLLGLLSIAMDTSREAAVKSMGSRIAATVTGQIQQENWATIPQWKNRVTYYDEQGKIITGQDTVERSSYTAKVTMLDQGVTYSENSGSASNPWAKQVVVLVALSSGTRGTQMLEDAQNALETGGTLPKNVLLNRSVIVNLQKQQQQPTSPTAITQL